MNANVSRYQRRQNSQASQNKNGHTHNATSESEYQDLQKRFEIVKEKKTALRIRSEQAAKALEECKKEAFEKFGVTSLDELKKLYEDLITKENEEMEKFKSDLAHDESLLNKIETELAELDN